jgi:hypothetical protein
MPEGGDRASGVEGTRALLLEPSLQAPYGVLIFFSFKSQETLKSNALSSSLALDNPTNPLRILEILSVICSPKYPDGTTYMFPSHCDRNQCAYIVDIIRRTHVETR